VNFGEPPQDEVRGITLLRTWVNRKAEGGPERCAMATLACFSLVQAASSYLNHTVFAKRGGNAGDAHVADKDRAAYLVAFYKLL
jgi:hypothetical protein